VNLFTNSCLFIQEAYGKNFHSDEKNSHDQSDELELGKEDEDKGNDRGVYELGGRTVVEKVERPVDLEKIIGRDDIVFEELVAQVEIDEGKFDDVQNCWEVQMGMKMQEIDIEKEHLHPVGDDIDLGPEDRLLFQKPRIDPISHVSQPMDTQTDKIVGRVHLDYGQSKKCQGENQTD
jgi:hypothetical protein